MDRLQEMVRLHRMGVGVREIARTLRLGANVERAYRIALIAAGLLEGPVDALPELEALKTAVLAHRPLRTPPQQTSSVADWRPRIEAWLQAGLGPRAIHDRLRLEQGAAVGSLSAIKRLCLRIEREHGVRPEDVAIPVETLPGEIAQVDFGEVDRLYDPDAGVLRRAWVFVMVLGYSRHLFAQIVFDQRAETWQRLHVEAFEFFGGVPETIVPDNLKAAVVRAAFAVDGGTALHRSYRALARHFGFRVDPAPPYAPEKKGKVESAVRYVKHNFFTGRGGHDVRACREELARWVREIAGTRVHGTTHRRPLELFERIERTTLRTLPIRSWSPEIWHEALVHRDSHVQYDKRLYSVPWRCIGRRVWLCVTGTSVVIYADDERVATHARRAAGLRSTIESHLPDHRGALRHRSRAYWQERADRIGPETAAYVREVFDQDDVLSQLRTVQAVVTHLEGFPRERADAATRRARHYGNHRYQGLKDILRQGLDLIPLEHDAPRVPSATTSVPRFARDVRSLLH